MADRYWVGGSGTWDNASTANWSATSGGASGASAPTSADNVIINASSGSTFTITLGANITIFSADNMQNAVGLTIDFNGYNITCVGNNVNIWRSNTTTLHLGTPDVYFTYSGGVGTRSIIGNTQTTNQLNVYVTAGTDIVALINNYNNVDFTGFSGSHANASNKSIYGNLLVSSGMTWTDGAGTTTFAATSGTKLITTNGKVLTSLTFGGVGGTWQLQDAMTLGSTRSATLTNGTLDLNGQTLTALSFNSNFSSARTIAFGLGKFVLSGNATVWNTSTITNLTITGTPVVDLTYALAVAVTVNPGSLPESSSISFNIKAGTYALTLALGNVRNIDFTGFAGSFVSSTRTIFGNLTLSSGMTVTAGAGATTFAATSGVKTITTNGKLVDFPMTFNGVGGTWQLQDALTLGATRTVTLTNGALDLNAKTLTTGIFSSSNSNVRTLTMTGASVVVLGSGASAWTMATSTNATVNASGSTISMNSASAKTFSGGGRTYGTLVQGGAGVLTVAGSNTFADISNATQPATVRLTAGTTQTVSAFSLSGTSGNLITLDTTVAGTRATLSDASGTVSVSFVSIKDINATGGATWDALTANGNVDAGNNLGWNFSAVVDRRIIRQVFRPVFREIFHPIF